MNNQERLNKIIRLARLILSPDIGKYLLMFLPAVITMHGKAQAISDSIVKIGFAGPPSDVIKKIQLPRLHFVNASGNYINYGIAGDTYKYFILKLNSNSSVTERYLSIDNTSLDTISIYRMYNHDSSRLMYLGGYLVPFDKSRKYVWHTIPVEITSAPSFYLVALKLPRNI